MKNAKNYYNFKNQNVFDRAVIITGTYGRKRFSFHSFSHYLAFFIQI